MARLCALMFLLLSAAPAAAQNLLLNGSFDADLSGWDPGFSTGAIVEWSDVDSLGSALSGSVRITNVGGHYQAAISQCIQVFGLTDYRIEADLFLPEGQSAQGNVGITIDAFLNADCTHFVRGVRPLVQFQRGEWQTLRATVNTDIARAVLVTAHVLRLSPGALVGHVDNVDFRLAEPVDCEDAGYLCLLGNRFAIQAQIITDDTGLLGPAFPVRLTDETGYFWFFDEDNVELLIKVLDACQDFDRFWVFAAGLTNVGVQLSVLDSLTGESRYYSTARGTPFPPLLDTDAFSGCPQPGGPPL